MLVVGNPANTNCLIVLKNAPSIPRQNFSALTRLDHNRAKAQVALKAGVSVAAVKNTIIWCVHVYPCGPHALGATTPARSSPM